MPVDDAAHIGQANPGAFKFIGSVQTLKNAKKLVGIGHIKPHPVIADENNGLVCLVR